MDPWTIFSLAFAAVILYTWGSKKSSPNWYLGCAVPLLYGGAVAGVFLEQEPFLALKVLIFGTALPVVLLVLAWAGARESPASRRDDGDSPEQEHQTGEPARHQ